MIRRLGIATVLSLGLASAALAANPHEPQKRLNAHDQAWARKIVLTRADLPGGGWLGQTSSDEKSTCRSFNPDESALTETGRGQSLEFSRNGSFVTSMAGIFLTPAQAQRSWNLEVEPGILDCFAEGLKEAQTGEAKITIVSRGRLAFPRFAPRTAAFKVRLLFNVQGVKLYADLHLVCLGRGRANAAFMTLSAGRPLTPLPAGLDRALASRVAERLRS